MSFVLCKCHDSEAWTKVRNGYFVQVLGTGHVFRHPADRFTCWGNCHPPAVTEQDGNAR